MDIQVEHKSGQCVISLNRPEKKNALMPSMYEDIANAISEASTRDDCCLILLRGNGEDFTAGNDISTFASATEEGINKTIAFMRALMLCKLPVVAEVKGNAIGIGTTLLLHCDFVVASSNTHFMMPFINLGLLPEYASSYILPKTSGYLNAAKWLMLGAPFNANEALNANVVTYVCEPEELTNAVNEVCGQLLNRPRSALIQTKALLKNNSQDIADHMDIELKQFAKALQSDSAKEAFDAFLSKRPINKHVFLK